MLSGRTSVFIDTTKSDDDAEQTTKPEMDDGSTTGKDGDTESFDFQTGVDGKKKPLDRSKYGKFIIHFGK